MAGCDSEWIQKSRNNHDLIKVQYILCGCILNHPSNPSFLSKSSQATFERILRCICREN